MSVFRPFLLVMAGVLLMAAAVFGSKQPPVSPLATAPTHWDEGSLWKYDGANRVVDMRDGRIQSVSQLREGPYAGLPEQAARAFLDAHKDWVGLEPSVSNLKVVRVAESPMGNHVTFVRVINGIVVYPGDLVVTLSPDNYVLFYYSSLYTFPDMVSTGAGMSAEQAEQVAVSHLRPTGPSTYAPQTELVIWAGDNRDVALCWKFRAYYEEPMGDWEVLVDAGTGEVRRVKDQAVYDNGTGMVFDPDPLSSAGVDYNAPGYVDGNDANTTQLQGQRLNRTLLDITGTVIPFVGTLYQLTGPWVNLQDLESPAGAPVTQLDNTAFHFTRDGQGFEDVMCYYHIDKSQRWIQSLGFNNIQHLSIAVDPHGLNGADNSHYVPGDNHIAFGEGGVDDAEDADVVWHEYGHAIQRSIVPGWGGGDEERMGEGFGDYWATSYSRSQNSYRNNWVFNWDGHNPFWAGRAVDANLHYPENNTGVHFGGQIWSQACYDAETVIGRAVMDRIVLQHHFALGGGASMLTAAQAIVTADINLYSGQHLHAISDAFVPRGLLTRPGNDVCGGYNISSLPYADNGSTATADNDLSNCIGATSPDVFYTLLPQECSTQVTVSLCGSGYDTGLCVRTGGGCPGSTVVASNDDFCGTSGLHSEVAFTAAPGETYYIVVHGYSTYAGAYTMNVTGTPADPVPANDACPGSLAITSLPYSNSGGTCAAANDYPNCVTAGSRDVFYSLTLPDCQTVTVSLCDPNTSYDTALEVRWGGGCPGAQPVACNDDNFGCPYSIRHSTLSFVASAQETYYIIVSGYDIEAGAYTLHVDGVPFTAPNDHCSGTTVIAALPFTDVGNTRCATHDFDVCVSGSSVPDVVYSYTPASCRTLRASLCLSGYDTGLEIRRGGDCPGDAEVVCDDDACSFAGGSEATFFAAAGVPYYFIVHGYEGSFNGDRGPFEFQLFDEGAATPPNDVCAGALSISSLPYVDWGTTTCAANEYSGSCVGASAADVVYRMNIGASYPCMNILVSLCGSNYDTGLRIGTGGACPGTTQVACDDDSPCQSGGDGYQSNVVFTATPGQDYWIVVDGFGLNAGTYQLSVQPTCQPLAVVAQRSGNDIQLDWMPPAGAVGGSLIYKVYRAATPNVQPIPANLIGTTATTTYVDAGQVGDPDIKLFYAVTADLTFVLAHGDTESPPAKTAGQGQAESSMAAVALTQAPYVNPALERAANPEKQVEARRGNEYNRMPMNPYPQNSNFPAGPK